MEYRNPKPTVDVIIRTPRGVVLIKRRNPPHGWALPGGFVDEWEPVEAAAVREALEETSLDVALEELLYVYSDPARDPRQHTMSVVFTGTATGSPTASDDAADAVELTDAELRVCLDSAQPQVRGLAIAFDHARILRDYLVFIDTGKRPRPIHGDG